MLIFRTKSGCGQGQKSELWVDWRGWGKVEKERGNKDGKGRKEVGGKWKGKGGKMLK